MGAGHSENAASHNCGSINIGAALTGVVYDLTSDSNNGTLSWSVLGGNSGNFNIANTIYFKQRAYGSVSKGSGGSIINFPMNDNWSGSGRLGLSRSIDLNVMAVDGTTILQTIHVATDGAGAYDDGYDDGYEAGWAAAAEGSGRSGDTVKYPSSTVGQFDSQTATASLDGEHDFGWDYSARISYNGRYYYRGISSACSDSHRASVSWS